jgi:hypothetical protein
MDRQNWYINGTNDPFRRTTQECVLEASPAMRSHPHEIDIVFIDVFTNNLVWNAEPELPQSWEYPSPPLGPEPEWSASCPIDRATG